MYNIKLTSYLLQQMHQKAISLH